MQLAMSQTVQKKIEEAGIIAVLEMEAKENAVPVAKALLEGGITVIELALRTAEAIPSISEIAKEVPQMYIGVGTIIEPGQAVKVNSITGVRFGVSPGINPAIVKEALAAGLSFAPGVATPSDIEQALSLGCRVVKFFPAEGMGGLTYLKSINAPYNHLGIRYIPLGGVTPGNLESYAKFAPVLAIGGSWIANKELINAQDWKEITKRAREAKEIWDNGRG